MSSPGTIPVLPPQYKTLNHCLKIASEHDVRDPVVAYWCRFYSVQQGLAIDKTSKEAKQFLLSLMDWLEKRKKELVTNEAITNEAVAEAHIENYALKLFQWADGQDRAGIFNKNVVKTFYTAGILIDVLTNFNKGELSEDLIGTRKYAKWKAAYINNCLKNGETPQAGPFDDDELGDEQSDPPTFQNPASNPIQPLTNTNPGGASAGFWPPIDSLNQPSGTQQPAMPSPSSSAGGYTQPTAYSPVQPTTTGGGPVNLSIAEMVKAQKYCKWAQSALEFEDVSTAINHLERTLRLLKTGQDQA